MIKYNNKARLFLCLFLCLLLSFFVLTAYGCADGDNVSSNSSEYESGDPDNTSSPDDTGEDTADTAGGNTEDTELPPESSEVGSEDETPEWEAVIDKYDLMTAMKYIWEGNTVYNESVMFVGNDDEASLMYTPDGIISVRSPDLKTEYKEGVDYTLKDGKLCLTENTSIPYMKTEEYYPQNAIPNGSFPSRIPEHPNIRFGEGDTFIKYQVYVTYTHSDSWDGYIPEGQSEKFARTIEKLENGENVKILFFGDSITEGYNSSGFVGVEPYAEPWPKMVASYLSEYYGNDKVEYINTAVAGQNSAWAFSTVQQNVISYEPDLVVIAFGMNDGGSTALAQTMYMRRVIDAINARLPDTEVALVSTMLPNDEVAGFWGNQYTFEEKYLENITVNCPQAAIVRMTTMHSQLLESKEYYHMTGNNVNHPNDFLGRVYAQSIVKTITGE